MKLISLNTWGGKYFEPLINFIKKHSKDTDIFCLQEIYSTTSNIKQYKNLLRANLLEELKKALESFRIFYFPTLENYDDEAKPTDFNLLYGPAIFIKKSIKVNNQENYFIYRDKSLGILKRDFSNLATPLQYINFTFNNKEFSIFNYHGTSHPKHKLDSANRLKQAKKVRGIMDSKQGAKIIVGDFNILPETKTLKIIGNGMRNLIEDYKIPKTRSYLSPYAKTSNFQKFADYTFVTNDIHVEKFEVPDMEISDHLPMILEFS